MRNFTAKILAGFLALTGVGFIGYGHINAHTLDKQDQILQPSLQINKNCSATVIASDEVRGTYLITAHHCVDKLIKEGKDGEITGWSTDVMGMTAEIAFSFSVADWDEVNDLALLHTKAFGFEVALIATEKPVEGQEAWVAGYPLGLPRQLTAGFYGLNMVINGMNHQRTTNLIAGGNSGGGLFVIEDGVYKLVGVTSKGMLNPMLPAMFTPIGLYSDLDPIHVLVDDYI